MTHIFHHDPHTHFAYNMPITCGDYGVSERIILPTDQEDCAVYHIFMQHLPRVARNRLDIKILHALQYTADATGTDVTDICMMLVQMGLRAPRLAFPASFLEQVDLAVIRHGRGDMVLDPTVMALRHHWDQLGEDRWAGFRYAHATPVLTGYLTV